MGTKQIASTELHYRSPVGFTFCYAIAPSPGQISGWFPTGAVSVIGGPSDSGKTTWLYDMLMKQSQKAEVLGHRTIGMPFRVLLSRDLGQHSFMRTLRRIGLLPSFPATSLSIVNGEPLQAIVNAIESLNPTPQIVLVENADDVMSPNQMPGLREIAERFDIALLMTVAPTKWRSGEPTRERLGAWGRDAETVLIFEPEANPARRILNVLLRNAPSETFTLEFQQGKLIQVSDEEKASRPSEKLQQAKDWIIQELQSSSQLARHMGVKAREAGIGQATFECAIAELVREHILAPTLSHGIRAWELLSMKQTIDK